MVDGFRRDQMRDAAKLWGKANARDNSKTVLLSNSGIFKKKRKTQIMVQRGYSFSTTTENFPNSKGIHQPLVLSTTDGPP